MARQFNGRLAMTRFQYLLREVPCPKSMIWRKALAADMVSYTTKGASLIVGLPALLAKPAAKTATISNTTQPTHPR